MLIMLMRKASLAFHKGILLKVLYHNLKLQYYLNVKRDFYDHSKQSAVASSSLRFAALKARAEKLNLTPIPNLDEITNQLPNSGGIEFEEDMIGNQGKIVSNEFEGIHVADAFRHSENWRQLSFVRLAESIADVLTSAFQRPNFSLLELGCGGGAIFNVMRYLGGDEYIGVEINSSALKNSEIVCRNSQHFRALNLQQEINFSRHFDCVCSFEVFEHLKEEYTDTAIRTIANHLDEHSYFIGTISHVPGIYHINAHPKSWWLEKFAQYGLGYKDEKKNKMFEQVIGKSHPFNWYPRTTSIFVLNRL